MVEVEAVNVGDDSGVLHRQKRQRLPKEPLLSKGTYPLSGYLYCTRNQESVKRAAVDTRLLRQANAYADEPISKLIRSLGVLAFAIISL